MRRIVPQRDWRLRRIDLRSDGGNQVRPDEQHEQDFGVMTPELAQQAR